MKSIELNNDIEMPAIGLGTFPMNNLTLFKAVYSSLFLGCRSFDTASAYGNEKTLGRILKISLLKRDKIFITTKLSNKQQREGDVEASLKESLRNLNTEYVDLYLMHWPNTDTYLDSWKQMEKMLEKGLAKAIGVCNFHEIHLEKLLDIADIIPAVNQIELHPLMNQKELVLYCKELGIQVEAYTPLGQMHEKITSNKKIQDLAFLKKKSISQIILRWNYQNNIISIPKTKTYKRLKENISIFDFSLSDEEMKLIDGINENLRLRYDPENCDFSKL
ncbi:MAG: aldo/keto reductase [Clostridiales bacterium]|nr:aldo/keto reductase [Clostridiales bacterium]